MSSKIERYKVVIPGDDYNFFETNAPVNSKPVTFGPGLRSDNSLWKSDSKHEKDQNVSPYATLAGLSVVNRKKNAHFVMVKRKRYVAAQGERVIGQILLRHAEGYKVDIGASSPASLGLLEFEGATKRNRPYLAVGALVYSKIDISSPFMEPSLTCVDLSIPDHGMGELKNGFLVTVDLATVRRLQNPKSTILQTLGTQVPFEIAIGSNGRIWINSFNIHAIQLIASILICIDNQTDDEINSIIRERILLSKLE